jgi:hypothetical protein
MPVLPVWMHGIYPITTSQLQESICGHLCQAGSSSRQGCVLAPNTLLQFALINQRIRDVMLADPLLMAICGPANCHPIARIYTIADGLRPTRGVHAPSLALPVPAPGGVAVLGVDVFD